MGVGLPTAQSLIFGQKKLRGRLRRRCGETDGVPEVDNPPSEQQAAASPFDSHFVQISETRLSKNSGKQTNTGLTTESHRNLEVMRPDNEFKEKNILDMTQKKGSVLPFRVVLQL